MNKHIKTALHSTTLSTKELWTWSVRVGVRLQVLLENLGDLRQAVHAANDAALLVEALRVAAALRRRRRRRRGGESLVELALAIPVALAARRGRQLAGGSEPRHRHTATREGVFRNTILPDKMFTKCSFCLAPPLTLETVNQSNRIWSASRR